MTSVEELKNALKETLEQKGVLNQIKAMMRKEIYDSIENDDNPKPQLSKENLIINELIKDYLKYNNYSNSSYVFQSETGQPKDIYDRNSLSKNKCDISFNLPSLINFSFSISSNNSFSFKNNNLF